MEFSMSSEGNRSIDSIPDALKNGFERRNTGLTLGTTSPSDSVNTEDTSEHSKHGMSRNDKATQASRGAFVSPVDLADADFSSSYSGSESEAENDSGSESEAENDEASNMSRSESEADNDEASKMDEEVEETDHFNVEDEHFKMPRTASMMSMNDSTGGSYTTEDYEDYSGSSMDSDGEDGSSLSGSKMSGSCVTESDWSSDDDSDFDDLMADLPIALGRQGPPAPHRPHVPPLRPAPVPAAPVFPTTEGLPVFSNLPVIENADAAIGNPLEGLAMLQNIRSELEQVGRMIVAKSDGQKFLQRAHILASINWLATNVPACVLDHLGKEIRGTLERAKTKEKDQEVSIHMRDDSSEASDLSDGHLSDLDEFAEDVDIADYLMETQHQALRKTPLRRGSLVGGVTESTSMSLQQEKPSTGHSKQTAESFNPKSLSRKFSNESGEDGNLPFVTHFQCALLFVDISGFTQLSTLLDPENLSKVINSYFQAIVNKVTEFQGDIQKFAGDALFAEWRVSPSSSLAQCVEAAAACASSLVKDCADFPVMSYGGSLGKGSPITHLNVHCGLGVGEMAGIHIGDSKCRREYLYVGNPILQATQACDNASLGQVVASRKVFNVLSWSGIIDEPFQHQGHDFFVITDRNSTKLDVYKLAAYASGVRNAKSRGVTDHVDGLQVDALIEYRRLMSLYVHPVVVSNDVAASDEFRSSRANSVAQERQREEAELRSVYVVFINPWVTVDLTGGNYEETAQGLNDIMVVTTRELERYNGHLRQFIMDDKGLVLIATFGLRGSTFPNLVAERALPATVVIHNALQMELGIDSRIGATFGDVYCGPVGGAKRNEYAVMGPAVNLAARLMASPENPGILVDNAVRSLAARSYSFNALTPVNAKGYKEAVKIFEPLAALERPWGDICPTFVGRKDEIVRLMEIASSMLRNEQSTPRMVLISSSSGMGKSTMLAHSIEHIRKMLGRESHHLMVAKNVGNESDAPVPFRTIRPILLKALQHYSSDSSDTRSTLSQSISQLSHSEANVTYDSVSVCSGASSADISLSQAANCLRTISASLNARPGIAELVQGIVLEDAGPESLPRTRRTVNDMVKFAAQVFRRCTQGKKLSIIALDDIHHSDAASWLLLREIFETCNNVFIVGTTFSAADSTFRMEEEFWLDLSERHAKNGRFSTMELGRLSYEDLERMAMKALGVTREELSVETLNEVVVQSGGMPRFANKILEGIKERLSAERVGAFTEASDAIAEIILHRVDTFDLSVRNTLNVGAVLGESFSLADVIAVLKESSDAKEADLRRQTVESLKLAWKEGILFTGVRSSSLEVSDEACDHDDTLFTFYHAVWRSTLLGLMLDSRKRDVHRKIALAMEKRMQADAVSLDFQAKLYSHWKATGDTTRATDIAILAGKEFERRPFGARESVALYRETLEMWGWNKDAEGNVAGFTSHVLGNIEAEDLSNILRLMAALGRSLSSCGQTQESITAFEDTLRIFQVANASPKLRDRSIVFPAFVGLSEAIADGHIHQDVSCRYEQALLRRFLEDTRIHGRLIHHIYALYLQMIFYSRQDEIEKAIAVQSIIKKLYKPEKHSELLRSVYGIDAGAMSYSMAAYFELVKGDTRGALRSCRHVFKELLGKVQSDANQAFSLMYPLALILKEAGFSSEARAFFQKVVVDPFGDRPQDGFSILTIYEALLILFSLTGKKETSDDQLAEYAAWALKRENLLYDEKVNIKLGRLGRCGSSISAEICYLLATQLPDGPQKDLILDYGSQIASHAAIFDRKHGLTIARKQVQSLSTKLKLIGGCDNLAFI